MVRVQDFQPSFNAGELTPRLAARTDFSKYRSGLETCLNLIPMSEGGLMRRPGSRYVAEMKSNSVKGRLKQFEFSTTQAYALELGGGAMRFYRYQGQITVGDTDAAITNGTFDSDISGWDDRSTGGAGNQISHDSTNNRLTLETNGTAADDIGWAEQDVSVSSGNKDTEHVLKFRVAGDPGDKVEVQVGTTSTGAEVIGPVEREVGYHCLAFTPGATTFYVQFRNLGANADKDVFIDDVSLIDDAAVEIDTPWAEADLYQVEGPQSADVLYLFHGDHPTHKLQRFGHTTWSLVEVAWQDGPYLPENTTATTLNPASASGVAVTVTASSTEGINGGDGFQSTDVGRLLRYKKSSEWGWGVIVAVNSTTSVDVHVKKDFEATPDAQTTWRLGAWSGTTGYPQTSTFFEQRLYVAATSDQPQTFWASQTGDFENFKPDNDQGTIEDDDALNFTLSADNVNAIRWLSAGDDTLAIGTVGGEWIPTPAPDKSVLTFELSVRRQTTHGSAQIQPLRVGNVVLFVQTAGRKVREFGFSFQTDGYQAPDMTRLAQHVTTGGIVEMSYAEEPESLVYAVRDDGQLLTMTYRREEDVVGWARHVLGGRLYASLPRVWRVDSSSETYTNETTDAGDSGDADVTPFPSSEAVGDYVAFGHTEPFTELIFDYANGTAGVDGEVAWEYWDGAEWAALAGVTDNTSGFTAAAADDLSVTWTEPDAWKKRVVSSGPGLYYVRARVTTVYSTNPVLDQVHVPGAPVVESVAVIPGADGAGQVQDSTARDEVWVTVRRTINGATKRYIEVLERPYEDEDDPEDAYFADAIITYDGAAATTITGLDHLEGETVKVWADGGVVADKTVASGQITLDSEARVVQIGLGYTHRMKTLKMGEGNPAGTAVGKTKRHYALTIVVQNSHTIRYGPSTGNLQMADFRAVSDPMDAAVPLFTGEKRVQFPGDYNRDARIVCESDDPAPFTLLALAPESTVNPLV